MLVINMIDKSAISIGDIRRCGSLAVARIYADDNFRENVLMLNEAIKSESFSVTETGTVKELYVENKLDNKVFIVCGDLVEGASQNRYSIFPTLVMPNSNLILPVNCAQERQGLITGNRGRYGTNDTIVMPSIRSGVISQKNAWDNIQHTTTILGRMDPTRDYAHADKTADVSDYIEAVGKIKEGQVGIVAGVRSRHKTIYYTDFFGNQSIMTRTHPKLAKSFGIVARVHEGNADHVKKDDIVNFLKLIEIADGYKKDHVGGGTLYVLDGSIKGSALAYKNATIQVSMRQDYSGN